MWAAFTQRLRALKRESLALYLAARHPLTPWHAKLVTALVVAYAFSPIDLVPDFIPVLGYLDDLLLVPMGVALAIRLVPPAVLAECREKARAIDAGERPVSRVAGAVIVVVWIALAVAGFLWVRQLLGTKP